MDRTDVRRLATVAVAAALPVVVLAVRLGTYRGHVFLRGDFALLDIGAQRAAHWDQLLGAYDRFGWRHPGPAYFYLLAAARVLVGGGLAAQSQMVLACAVNGTCGGLSVWILARRSRRPLAAALMLAALVLAATALLGQIVMLNPWTPYVTVMPLFLLTALAVAAATGSAVGLAAALLVGSLVVQTDLGTAPLVAVLGLAAVAGWTVTAANRRVGEGTYAAAKGQAAPGPVAVPVAVLVLLTAASWVPVLIEQVTSHPGNLTLIWRFFASTHSHPGVTAAASVVGSAQAALVGLRGAGRWGLALSAVPALGGLVLGLRRRSAPAVQLAVLGLIGTAVGVAAATAIVGPPYGYLVAWTVVPALASWASVVLSAVDRGGLAEGAAASERPTSWRRDLLDLVGFVAASGALLGCLVKVFLIPAMPHYDATEVRRAWSYVAGPVQASAGPVFIDITDPTAWALAAGLADEIRARGGHVMVPPAWSFQYGPNMAGTSGSLRIRVAGRAGAGLHSVGQQLSVGLGP